MERQRSAFTEREWRERMRRFRQCELTVAEFCEDEGVSTASFYVWQRRLREAGTVPGDSGVVPQAGHGSALFVPVSVRPMVGEVRIDVADGVVIRLPLDVNEQMLRTCLRAALDATSIGEDR